MRFAARENAILGQIEVGVGAAPGAGGVQHLGLLLGRGRAMEAISDERRQVIDDGFLAIAGVRQDMTQHRHGGEQWQENKRTPPRAASSAGVTVQIPAVPAACRRFAGPQCSGIRLWIMARPDEPGSGSPPGRTPAPVVRMLTGACERRTMHACEPQR